MKANKELLHDEFKKIWKKDERMTNYCANKAVTMAILPDGGIVVVEKQGIDKDFCFGESGYDMDDAIESVYVAMTSQDYFLHENMKTFNNWLRDLEDAKSANGNWMLIITDKAYIGQREDCRIRDIQFVRVTDVLEVTGPAFLNELPGTKITVRGCSGHLATADEIDAIEQAYKEAAADHEKKVKSYLKRYGTSKVHAWTYWRDE